jgi:Cft2 family RNA processing exonuclease
MYRLGFSGQVICTRLTANCVKEALRDTVKNVDAFDSSLFDQKDVDAIDFYCPDEREGFQLGNGYKVLDETDLFFSFSRTGHLAGAVAITFVANVANNRRVSICFGGDLGPQIMSKDEAGSLLRPVHYPSPTVDYLVLESTYGGKGPRPSLPYDAKISQLGKVLERALSPLRGSNPQVIMPTFTLGRTQDLIIDLAYLITRTDFVSRIGGHSPVVVVESSLARAYSNYFRKEFDNWWVKSKPGKPTEHKMRLLNRGHHLFTNQEPVDIDCMLDQLFSGTGSRVVTMRSATGSDFELCYDKRTISDRPVIYLSSSGMCSSGPVMSRLRTALRYSNATVAFVGYIPPVNEAFRLKDKAASWKSEAELATMFSDGPHFVENGRLEDFEISLSEVKAALVDLSDIYSGHADELGLCEYALGIDMPSRSPEYKPIHIILVHGEDKARAMVRRSLQKYAEDNKHEGKSRELKDILTPTVGSGWYDLEKADWDSLDSNEPSWQESLKLLAEADDLQDQLAKAWYHFKSCDGQPFRQTEYIRRLEGLLDNLEEWRRRFRELREKALHSKETKAEPSAQDYDKVEIYLDCASPEIADAANILGLTGRVTRAQARLAYMELTKANHPDSKPDADEGQKASLTQKMQEINNAYRSVLMAAFAKLN